MRKLLLVAFLLFATNSMAQFGGGLTDLQVDKLLPATTTEIIFATGGSDSVTVEADGTAAVNTANYENLVTDDNDIPNRQFVENKTKFMLGTRWMSGGNITGDADPTKIDVSAGTGEIFDPVTDEFYEVAWSAQNALAVATDPVSFVWVTNAGVVQVNDETPTFVLNRDKIFLGSVIHPTGTVLFINDIPLGVTDSIGPTFADYALLIGPQNVGGGNLFSGSGVDLSINKTAGSLFQFNVNVKNDKSNPHSLGIPQCTGCQFIYTYRNGLGGSWINSALTTFLVPGFYDKDGVLTAVLPPQWTAIKVFLTATATILQYGQEVYPSAAAARNDLDREINGYSINPDLSGALYVSAILIQGSALLSNTAEFLEIKGIGGGGSAQVNQNNWTNVHIDSTASPYDVVGCRNIIIVDATGGDVTTRVPDSATSNDECENKFILDNNTNDLIVTTIGGTQNIGNATSQTISSLSQGITILSDATNLKYLIIQDSRPSAKIESPDTSNYVVAEDTFVEIYQNDIRMALFSDLGFIVDGRAEYDQTSDMQMADAAFTHKLYVDSITGTSSDSFSFGDGTDTNKSLVADNGDANEPELRYNSSTNEWEFSNDGTTFNAIGAGGATVITTEGDLIIGGSGGVPERRAIGTDGQVFTSDGTTAGWENPVTPNSTYAIYTKNDAQSFPDASHTTIIYNDIDVDNKSGMNTSTGVYTIQTGDAGVYEVKAAVRWVNTSNLNRVIMKILGGGITKTIQDTSGQADMPITHNGSALFNLTVGQTVHVTAYQDDSGGSARVLDTGEGNWFSIHKVP